MVRERVEIAMVLMMTVIAGSSHGQTFLASVRQQGPSPISRQTYTGSVYSSACFTVLMDNDRSGSMMVLTYVVNLLLPVVTRPVFGFYE